jgi:hypothetical protein
LLFLIGSAVTNEQEKREKIPEDNTIFVNVPRIPSSLGLRTDY